MKAKKWTVTIEVVEVRGGMETHLYVDHAFGQPAPHTMQIIGVMKDVAKQLVAELVEAAQAEVAETEVQGASAPIPSVQAG